MGRYKEPRTMREYRDFSPVEQLDLYNAHNPGCLQSADVRKRLYGTCGCPWCARFRQEQHFHAMAMNQQGRTTNKMGSINICDRCGALVKGDALGRIELSTSSDSQQSEYHVQEICPACVGDFMLMWETPVGERERAYSEPWKAPEEIKSDAVDQATVEQLAAAILTKVMAANGPAAISGARIMDVNSPYPDAQTVEGTVED